MRETAKQLVIDVFYDDIKGDVGKLARSAVPKEDKRDITNRVHRNLNAAYHQGYTDGHMAEHSERKAGRFWTFILDTFGCAGITLPHRVVYLHPDHWNDDRIRAHERAHIAQIDRDGPWKWSFLVVWYVLRYGYTYSPYEIEARDAETLIPFDETEET